MLTVILVFAIAAFICVLVSAATGKVPLWVGVILLCVLELLRALPLGPIR